MNAFPVVSTIMAAVILAAWGAYWYLAWGADTDNARGLAMFLLGLPAMVVTAICTGIWLLWFIFLGYEMWVKR